MHLLRNLRLDSDSKLAKHFMPHQVAWIQAEKLIHKQHKQVVALAEKSVRIGWTYADAFKNVRKRLWFKGRDYLFATKDYPSALEYVRQCYKFADIFNLTRAIVSHGEENLRLNRVDEQGRPSAFTEEVKIGVIKFDNGSRIIAFSANPQAMSVYGGDVGLDKFAKHPNARLLWETAQARVTWNYDLAIWSSHDGEDTLFNEFAQEARAAAKAGQAHAPLGVVAAGVSPAVEPGIMPGGFLSSSSAALPYQPTASRAARTPPSTSGETPDATLNTCERENLGQSVGAEGRGEVAVPPSIANQTSKIENPHSPWNLYFRITLPDAIGFGLVDAINQAVAPTFHPSNSWATDAPGPATKKSSSNPTCATRSAPPPTGSSNGARSNVAARIMRLTGSIWRPTRCSAGSANSIPPASTTANTKSGNSCAPPFLRYLRIPQSKNQNSKIKKTRLGFDVAASGQGDLAAIYVDEARGNELWLRGLFTCRTEDWHFLKTVLFYFLQRLPSVQAAGDESGLGRQICWEAAKQFGSRFLKVNFASKKHDLGFALMNQLAVAEKRFPKSEADIAADYFALRKAHNGSKWSFSEGRNTLNAASHCDIAWAGALASFAHTETALQHRRGRRLRQLLVRWTRVSSL